MNPLRFRLCFLLFSLLTGMAFDRAIEYRPTGEFWDVCYFGSAATIDWLLFYLTSLVLRGKLCRDVESLYVASIVTNAVGFAIYMASSLPFVHPLMAVYNWTISGINYALIIRLTFLGAGDVSISYLWRGMVRGLSGGRLGNATREAQR